jgi:exopolysaccharide biosynthesis predicted pyruvyltransferase EpsI
MNAAGQDADRTVDRLRRVLSASWHLDALMAETPVGVLDFPDYGNVGDSAIWLGQQVLLRDRGLLPVYVSSINGFDGRGLARRLRQDGTILLQGGGNFGDLWPRHQRFREMIARDNPMARILQLPQSLYFEDERALDHARAIFSEHSDFHLLYRDDTCDDFAQEISGGRATRCPDAAFALRLERTREPDLDLLFLLRRDHERADVGPMPESMLADLAWRIADWPADPFRAPVGASRVVTSLTARKARLRRKILTVAGGRKLTAGPAIRHWDTIAQRRLDGGMELLSRARVIVTDRLHGHILCLVAGIPHVFLDNSYGKVSAFSRTWKTAGPLARQASNLPDALSEARKLLG